MKHKFDIFLSVAIVVCVREIAAVNIELPNRKFNLSYGTGNKPTPKRIICYFASWSIYDDVGFDINDIDPNLCSHIIYAIGNLDGNGTVTVWDPFIDLEKDT